MPSVTRVDHYCPSLEEIQELVGGYAEAIYMSDCIVLVNEDGRRMGLDHNYDASEICGQSIVGNVLVLVDDALIEFKDR